MFNAYNVVFIILIILCVLLVHLFKLIRLYLVLMEKKIPFFRFVELYLETTIINLAIPFKLGEILRILMFSAETKSFEAGFFSILTDRFFDTLSLMVLLLTICAAGFCGINFVMVVLLILLAGIAALYIGFPAAYGYLNRYIIINKTSKRAMRALKLLETMAGWHEYIKGLITGRCLLMMLFSVFGWLCEGAVLWMLAIITGGIFGVKEYAEYISSIFSASGSRLLIVYSGITIFILGSLCLVLLLAAWIRKLLKNRNEED